MFGRKPVRASAETGIDLDALLDDAIERVAKREAAGDKTKTPVTSRGEAMSRAVQSRSTANNSASQREKASESYRASREANRAAFIGKISSRGGMPIKELHAPFASEEDRYLLAGIATSAKNAIMPKERISSNNYFGVGSTALKSFNSLGGWRVGLSNFQSSYYDEMITATHHGIVTPGFGLYIDKNSFQNQTGKRMGNIQTAVLRESVVAILGDHGAEWVEPDPAIYENR